MILTPGGHGSYRIGDATFRAGPQDMNHASSSRRLGRTFWRLLVGATLTLGVSLACTTETIPEDALESAGTAGTPSAGSPGRSGAPNRPGGAAGMALSGAPNGAAGGMSAGGMSAGGMSSGGAGTGGMSAGGMSSGGAGTGGRVASAAGTGGTAQVGGAGQTSASCGNGMLDGTEECDDGNTNDGDGCSATCTKKCEQCRKTRCFDDPDLADAMRNCFGPTNQGSSAFAVAGPAAGKAKTELCQAVVSCARRTGCATAKDIASPITNCFCGSSNATECKDLAVGPKGACVDEIAAAAESQDFDLVQLRYRNGFFAVGLATPVLTDCDASACGRECLQNKTPSACDTCNLGPKPTGFSLVCPSYTGCYFSPNSLTCAPAVDCALLTGCGAHGAASCYAGGKGPCAKEFAAAAGSMDPSAVTESFKDPDSTTFMAADLLSCDAKACQTICTPTSTTCDRCALAAPSPDAPVACGNYFRCYFDSNFSAECAPALDCALKTGCGAQGALSCYGGGTGPCAAEFAAAAKSTDAAIVMSRLASGNLTYASGIAADALDCQVKNCKSQCFPLASGGAGSGGASN